MEYERKGVTITWQIKNMKYISQVYSPVISVDVMDGTKWKLGYLGKPNHLLGTLKFRLTIKREAEDNGPGEIGLHYEFSVNTLNRTSSNRNKIYTNTFQKNRSCHEVRVVRQEKAKSLISDTITIQCKIWRQREAVLQHGKFFVETRMRIEHCIFTGRVENFSDVSDGKLVTLKTISSPTGQDILAVNLFFFSPELYFESFARKINMKITVVIMDDQPKQLCHLKVFILDSSGDKTDTGKLERIFKMERSRGLTLPGVSLEELWEKADQYLVNDTLSLHCELSFCSGIEYEKVERAEYKTNSLDGVMETDCLNAVEFLTSREDILSDLKLHTATVTFPAHSAILSAKSPVFEAMFKTDMKETIQNCVHIDDVDAETVKHMLVFLYSDTLEELEWKDAMKLYFAADKYQLLSLKNRCTALLKQSLDLSNCCVLLLLADMHQDIDLKRSVHSYIAEYGQEVLHCDQWRDLEKTHPHLAITFFRDRYLKTNF